MVWDTHAHAATRRAAQATAALVSVAQRCYQVGQKVAITGSGFAISSPYDISVDGVDFGQSLTDTTGAFTTGLYPGGLGAGQAQIADALVVSDGTLTATTRVTITRATGALFGSGTGASPRRFVPFEVWDFAPRGPAVGVYLHYVSPAGRSMRTLDLGTSTGQCGSLTTGKLQLFPFTPSKGTWTLQFDTTRLYAAKPAGKVARLLLKIS